jgi:hypothetical protein
MATTTPVRTLFARAWVNNREIAMADSKQQVGKPDRDRVDKDDPSDVKVWGL